MGFGQIAIPMWCDNCGGGEIINLDAELHEIEPGISFEDLLLARTGWKWDAHNENLWCPHCLIRVEERKYLDWKYAVTGKRDKEKEPLEIVTEVGAADKARFAKWSVDTGKPYWWKKAVDK